MDDVDARNSGDLVLEVERWCEAPSLGIPVELLQELPEVSRDSLLQGLVAALDRAYPGSLFVESGEVSARAGSSAPLLVPGTVLHISLDSIPKTLLSAVVGMGVLWAIGGLPGPREVAATATASAATTFFDAFTRLTPKQATVAWYVARKAREGAHCRTTQIVEALGGESERRLAELKEQGVLREQDGVWSVTF